jgi:hypothetical protein
MSGRRYRPKVSGKRGSRVSSYDQTLKLTLNVKPMATHGYGDIATVEKKEKLKVLLADDSPAIDEELFVRDRDATLDLDRRYKTDSGGEAVIEIVAKPTVVAIVFPDSVNTREFSDNAPATMRLP